MLSFEGNTAPYLMYAYARIRSILMKANREESNNKISELKTPLERLLLTKLIQFPEIIDSVASDCFPNLLCNYLYELAGMFMRFYEECPILSENQDLRQSRLSLSHYSSLTLKQGLELLGIETLSQM